MNRPPRRARSPSSYVMGGQGFDPSRHSPIPIDYNDMERHQNNYAAPNQAYPYHPQSPASSQQSQNYYHQSQHQIYNNHPHGISNNSNPNFDQNGPDIMNATTKPNYHHNQPHNNYPATYQMDQHLPSTYRSTIRDQPIPSSSPPPLPQTMIEPNSIYKILCITNINPEVADGPVKEAISSEFSRFGDKSVSICHDGGERLVYIYFKTFEDARDARHSKLHTILFDRPIEIEPIYEHRPSPMHTPTHVPIFASRRRSVTPPDFIPNNGLHMRRPHGPVGQPLPPGPTLHHNEIMGSNVPPGYAPYPPRFSHRPAQSPHMNPLIEPPHHDRHYPEPIHQYSTHPQHHNHHPSSYDAPIGEPHRQYGGNPPPSRFSPGVPPGPNPLPLATYGHPPYRERERPIPDPYYARNSHPYHGPPEPRSYPTSAYNRAPPAGAYPPIDPHVHSPHYRPSNVPPLATAARRSPVAYQDPPIGAGPYPTHHHRFTSREFRREKFRENHLYDRDESKPSRVIFVTNIDPTKNESDIRELFDVYGIIEDLEVKKIGPDQASAIIKFSSMDCAYRAKTSMHSKYIGSTKVRVSYGKVNASRRLWLGGLGPTTTLELLDEEFAKFGDIISLDYVSGRPYGYVEYETPNQAQFAVMHLKGTLVAGADKRIRMEYVDSAERREGSVKNETNSQTSSKTSQYRGNDIWNNNDNELSERNIRKRGISPNEVNPKRLASTNNDEAETGYYDSTNRASTSSLTKSSNRSSPSSPALERSTNLQDGGRDGPFHDRLSYGIDNHIEPVKDKQVISKKPETFASRIMAATTIAGIVENCEACWNAQLILRNFNFNSTLYMCSGQQKVIDKYIAPGADDKCPVLRITQRWRLHPQPKLEEVKRHMQSGNLGIFIIKSRIDESPQNSQDGCKTPQDNSTPGSKQNGDQDITNSEKAMQGNEVPGTQPRPLKNLISYLEQKDAAGVVSVTYNDSDSQEHQKLLYTFPPCDFALNILKTIAPHIGSEELSKDEFLIGVLVGTIETKGI